MVYKKEVMVGGIKRTVSVTAEGEGVYLLRVDDAEDRALSIPLAVSDFNTMANDVEAYDDDANN